MKKWVSVEKQQIKISLHVIPNAKKNSIIGEHNNRLKVKISSPPVDGSANKEVKSFFAKLLGISKSKIEISKGEKSRDKEIIIKNYEKQHLNKLTEVLHANI